MPQYYDLIVFDWDGTLSDSTEHIIRSMQRASADAGLAVPEAGSARHIIGLGLKEAIAHLFPHSGMAERTYVAERYRHHYLSVPAVELFDGAREMLGTLHGQGFFLAVATGKGRGGLNHAFESTGVGHYFHASRCADECSSKPNPQMLMELMGELSVNPERTLMIGDTTHDLQMAKNANVGALAVSFGAHPKEDLDAFSPIACFEEFNQLKQWLFSLKKEMQ